MIKVIAYHDRGWMSYATDFRMWDHLTRAYGNYIQLIDNWHEANIPSGFEVVAFDEKGDLELSEFEPPLNAVYVFGRTGLNILSLVDYDISVRIQTPNQISLFGISAGSIALAHSNYKRA